MSKNKDGLYPHHRRPTSLGGDPTKDYNISWVDMDLHEAWHKAYGNLNAYQIAIQMNIDVSDFSKKRVALNCKYINGSPQVTLFGMGGVKDLRYRRYLLKILMKNKSLKDFINEVNSKWLDSAYHFYLIFFD